jgi:hypothetical protein
MLTYDQTKESITKYFGWKDGTQLFLASSIATGFVLSVVTSPIDVVKTKIMTSSGKLYTGVLDCIIKNYREGGISIFYRGFFPQWARFGPFNIIQLLTF